jgi:integrating conjugative element protein (TIGR03752 family)
MSAIRTNRWPVLAGGVFVALLIAVLLARCVGGPSQNTPAPPVVSAATAERPSDADGTDATLKTMAANMEDNAKLKAQVDAQETTMRELREEIAANNANQALGKVTEALAQLQQQNAAIADRLLTIESRAATPSDAQDLAELGIPEGAVPGNVGTVSAAETALTQANIAKPLQSQYEWIQPLGRRVVDGTSAYAGAVSSDTTAVPGEISIAQPSDPSSDGAGFADVASTGAAALPRKTPRYTLPANATLLDATALTAFIGRVPTNGTLTDGYRFKVLASADGLASNGYRLPPGIKSMVFAGTASGDWNLSCVRGAIDSLTFTYADGSVQSYGAGVAVEGEQSQSANTSRRVLGYLSDPQGVPCIKGEKVTNAPKVLTARFLAAAFEATSRGYAEAQTSNTVTAAGGVVRTIDDAAKFGAYTGLAGGAGEARDWLESRLGQIFDAIYAPPGQKVAIHLETQINLDQDAQGRRLDYTQPNHATHLD